MVQRHAASDGAAPGGESLRVALVAALLVWAGGTATLVGSAFQGADERRAAKKYAEVIAHCANGGTFAVGETRLVTCIAVDVWVY